MSGPHNDGRPPEEANLPVVEQVASTLAQVDLQLKRLPTPLTQANRRADCALRQQREHQPPATPVTSKPEPRCKRCGGELTHRDRVYCDTCLPHYRREQCAAFAEADLKTMAIQRREGADPSHGGEVARRRSATMARRRRELRTWAASVDSGSSSDPETLTREILPLIQKSQLSELMKATGLSLPYVRRYDAARRSLTSATRNDSAIS